MKISHNWLRELVELPAGVTVADIVQRLTLAGIEVEGVTQVGAGLSGAVVAEVRGKRRHPKADKLTLVDVFDGQGITQVVCGAPNVPEPADPSRAGEPGFSALVVWARPGARLPSGMTLSEREVRGIVSPGMLCAEDELGLSEDHGGILLLDAHDGLAIGADFASAAGLPDTVLELNITPNRPDCMGHVGVAREVSALFAREGARLRLPEADLRPHFAEIEPVPVEVRDAQGCPRYTARVLRGLRVRKSPLPVRLRLQRLGVRALSNLVDATNLALLEWGQPLHAFDLARLHDRRIVVRQAAAGETLTTLDGVLRALSPGDVVIADGQRGVALAGVMGGRDSEVTAATTEVLLEGAYFDPATIRRTGRRLKMHTEASHRFERGVDPNKGLVRASERCARLMLDLAGGEVSSALIDVYPTPIAPRIIALRPARTTALLGAKIPDDEQVHLLRALGLGLDQNSLDFSVEEPLRVTVPSFRPDLTREIDLIEEIGRLHGYDRVAPTLPLMRLEPAQDRGLALAGDVADRARDLCASLGLDEIQSYSFVAPERLRALGFAADDPRSRPLVLHNPLREDLSAMRTQLVPGLLDALRRHLSRGLSDVRLFEVGEVFLPRAESAEYRALLAGGQAEGPEQGQAGGPGARPRSQRAAAVTADKMPVEERSRVAGVLAGHRDHWMKPGANDQVDFADIAGLARAVAQGMGLAAGLSIRAAGPGEVPWLHPGVAAVMTNQGDGSEGSGGSGGERVIGEFGEIHPDLRRHLNIEVPAFAFELDLPTAAPAPPVFAPLPRFPAVTRDLSFFVAAATPAGELISALRAAGEPLLVDAQVVEDYREKGRVPEGKKGLLLSLTYRSPDRTLVDEEVQKAHDRVVSHLRARAPIDLR